MDELQVFEIKRGSAIERPAIISAAIRIATERYPCLTPQMVLPNGVQWTRDNRRIVLVTISAPYACQDGFAKRPGIWHSLWMIGDVLTGQIESGSIQVQQDDKPLIAPTDGPYSR